MEKVQKYNSFNTEDQVHNVKKQLYFIHTSYSSPNITVNKLNRITWVGHLARMEKMGNAFKILIEKSNRKIPSGRPSHMWESDIKIDLKERALNFMEWIILAQDRVKWRTLVNTILKSRF
jgi:hypothetical protein